MSDALTAVAATLENVEAAAAVAIETAEQRAVAAEAVAAQITDAAIRTELSDRIDEVAEDIISCREENQSLRTELASLRTLTENQIAGIMMQLSQAPQVIVAPASATPLIPQASQTEATIVTTVEPSSAAVEGPPVPQTPAQSRKPRLI